LPNIHIIQY